MADRVRTSCNRDCPDACSLLVTREEGRAVRLVGDPEDPVTRGFLCERTSRFLERQYAPDRFRSAMVRDRGRLRPLGLEAALDLAAERLAEVRERWGPAAILHYRSGGSLGVLKAFADRMFQAFGPVTVKRGDICSGAGEAAQVQDFGVSDSSDQEDLLHSRVIVLWGRNPHVSGVHLLPVLREAHRRGAVLLGIDPVRHRAAPWCEEFLQPRPGGDLALALAWARWLHDHGAIDPELGSYCDHAEEYRALVHQRSFEEWCRATGVASAEVARAADRYATLAPGAILVGWGMARRRHGSATVRAVDALGAIRGNLGVPGGGVSYYFQRRAAFDLEFLEQPPARTLAEACLGQEILDAREPPIQLVWVTAGNPVSMLPDADRVRAALADRFTVVVDSHPTDTTDVADLVLPARTLLEDEDLLGAYGNHFLRASRPAVEAPPGVPHEFDLLLQLARRLGVADALPGSRADALTQVTRRLADAGVDRERLARGPVRNPFAPSVLFADRRFPTPSGKVQLMTSVPAEALEPGAHGLRLMAVSHPQAQSSQWCEPLAARTLEARVHPRSATGLPDGARAWVRSRQGALAVVLVHDERIHPRALVLPKGGMMRDRRCANQLIPAAETDAGGGAVYYDEPVTLAPRHEPSPQEGG